MTSTHLLSVFALLTLVTSIHIPLTTVTPTAPLSSFSTPTPSPSSVQALEPRCDNGDCNYGGCATPLQAATVTSTILSVTSVPCYVTSYVTNQETIVSTVYSTETVTATETRKGVVYVIEYKPTPILHQSVFKTVIPVEIDMPTYWLETPTGKPTYETQSVQWKDPKPAPAPAPAPKPQPHPQPQPQPQPQPHQAKPAWTHVAAGPNANAGGDGWAVVADGQNGAGGAVWGNGNAGGRYSSAGLREKDLGLVGFGIAVGIVVFGELLYSFT